MTYERSRTDSDILRYTSQNVLLEKYDPHLHFYTSDALTVMLERFRGERALDLGCGDGRGAAWLSQFGLRPLGLDTSPVNRDQLRGDGHSLPFKDESFTVVLCLKVLEHVYDPLRFTGEVRRILRPGGYFLGSVAFLEPYHAMSYYHFSPLGLVDCLTRNDLDIIELRAGHGALASFFSTAFPAPRLSFPWPLAKPIGATLQRFLLSLRRVAGFAFAVATQQRQEYQRTAALDGVRFAGEFAFVARRA